MSERGSLEDRLLFGGVLFVLFESFINELSYSLGPCTNPAAKAVIINALGKLIIHGNPYSWLFGRHIALIAETARKSKGFFKSYA